MSVAEENLAVSDFGNVIALSIRLAKIMAEEVDLLEEMKISELGKLQKDKILALNALQAHQEFMKDNPEITRQISDEDREEYLAIEGVLKEVFQVNYRKLLVAKEVNQTFVDAVTDVVEEVTRQGTYDDRGKAGILGQKTLSVTLNEKV